MTSRADLFLYQKRKETWKSRPPAKEGLRGTGEETDETWRWQRKKFPRGVCAGMIGWAMTREAIDGLSQGVTVILVHPCPAVNLVSL